MKIKFLVCALIFVSFTSCEPAIKYIFSPDGKYQLSLFEHSSNSGQSFTIIAYGRLNSANELEDKNYIKVRNRWRDGWYGLITWEGEKAILFQPHSNFEEVNLSEKMELRKMKDQEFSRIYFSEGKDEYIRISNMK